jgi:hypothetical protein
VLVRFDLVLSSGPSLFVVVLAALAAAAAAVICFQPIPDCIVTYTFIVRKSFQTLHLPMVPCHEDTDDDAVDDVRRNILSKTPNIVRYCGIFIRVAIRPGKPGLSLVLDFVSRCPEKCFRDVHMSRLRRLKEM